MCVGVDMGDINRSAISTGIDRCVCICEDCSELGAASQHEDTVVLRYSIMLNCPKSA